MTGQQVDVCVEKTSPSILTIQTLVWCQNAAKTTIVIHVPTPNLLGFGIWVLVFSLIIAMK
jgi:hypothetical protein